MPSSAFCNFFKVNGQVSSVCVKKLRAEANVTEVKELKEEESKEKTVGTTQTAGRRDFSKHREHTGNLVTVHYLSDVSALSSYQLISSNSAEESGRGQLRRIACQLERKEKGAKFVRMEAVTDPGAITLMLSLENAEKMQCNVRPAPVVRITSHHS